MEAEESTADADAVDEKGTVGVAIIDAADDEDTVTAKDAELEPDIDEELGVMEEADDAENGEAEAPDEEVGATERAIEVAIEVDVDEGGTVIETYWNPET